MIITNKDIEEAQEALQMAIIDKINTEQCVYDKTNGDLFRKLTIGKFKFYCTNTRDFKDWKCYLEGYNFTVNDALSKYLEATALKKEAEIVEARYNSILKLTNKIKGIK